MLESGISINDALASLANQSKSPFLKKVLEKIREDIERGISLSDAFSKERKSFGDIFIGLIEAGEQSGTLKENLTFLSEWLEHEHTVRSEVKSVTLYPKIVLSAIFLLGGAMAAFIFPQLIPLFTNLDLELPILTRIFFKLSLFLKAYWLFVLAGILGFIVFLFLLNKIRGVRHLFHSFYLKIPFFGKLIIDYQIALICRLFSIMYQSGIKLRKSLGIVAESATNICYKESLEKIQKSVIKGTSFASTLSKYANLYPQNMIDIIRVGEKTGNLDKSFTYLAEHYSKEIKRKTKRLPSVMEPVLLLIIGSFVAVIVLSIILPIYEVTNKF
jgi:type II secretory pathway component PulF